MKSSTDTVLSATEHTPTLWVASALRLYSINKGTITVEADKPHNRWVIKRVWQDEQDRRCTKFVAEVYSEADAHLIVEAVNSYATLQSELTRAREREKELVARINADHFALIMEECGIPIGDNRTRAAVVIAEYLEGKRPL